MADAECWLGGISGVISRALRAWLSISGVSGSMQTDLEALGIDFISGLGKILATVIHGSSWFCGFITDCGRDWRWIWE